MLKLTKNLVILIIIESLLNIELISQTEGWSATEFPIIGYDIMYSTSYPLSNSTYQVLENGGINLIMNSNKVSDSKSVYDGLISYRIANTSSVLKSLIKIQHVSGNENADPLVVSNLLSDYSNNCIYGYCVWDEPWDYAPTGNDDFFDTDLITTEVKNQYPDRLAYFVLLPMYADEISNSEQNYKQYVDDYVISQSYKPQLFCVDYYPLLNGGFRNTYFQNLKILREKSMQYNIPFWTIVLASEHLGYKDPTINEIRMQVYSSLAYGAKGVGYYLYSLDTSFRIGYNSAILEDNFNITGADHGPKYDGIKTLNDEAKALGTTLLNLIPIAVYHNSIYPNNQQGINDDLFSNSDRVYNIVSGVSGDTGSKAMIGYFKHKTTDDDYLFIVNKDTESSHTFTINLNNEASSIYEISNTTGSEVLRYQNSTTISASVNPGSGRLYKIIDGIQEYIGEINDIERTDIDGDDRIFIAHNDGLVMINKTTGDRRYNNDGGANTPVVDIEIDVQKERVYICRNNGLTGNFHARDFDLNFVPNSLHNDGGANTPKTSVTYSQSPNYIYIGQRSANNGNVVALDRDDFTFEYSCAWGNKVNSVDYLLSDGNLYVGHDSGILRLSTSNGNLLNSYSSSQPIVNVKAVNNTAIFAALNNGSTGKLQKFSNDFSIENEKYSGDRIVDISVNSDGNRILVANESSQSFYKIDVSLFNQITSYSYIAPRASFYGSNLLLATDSYIPNSSGLSKMNTYYELEKEDGQNTPLDFSIHQNYPNPFNPMTRIQFDVKKESLVNLKVFDILGREISTLVDGIIKAGHHYVNFDASNLSSGIYFYRIEMEGFSKVMKMQLCK